LDWIYVDTNKEVGDIDHLKVFATPELADEWLKENDAEGVAFGYEVIEEQSPTKTARHIGGRTRWH
jgi:hypothetical protein